MARHARLATTEAVEDYLKALYRLSSAGEPPTVGRLATSLGVAAPSVTNMLARLVRLGLATHPRYAGVRLTPRGRRIALEVVRHHRLWELYLSRRLGLPLDRVHAEAERLEHVMSDDLEGRLEAMLGGAVRDPHGHPIPRRGGGVAAGAEGRVLSDLAAGDRGIVARVDDRSAGRLRALARLGLLPGVRVRMIRPGSGRTAHAILIGSRRRRVGTDLARLVRVR
ncbi:MAG: metal-dependent transcriptional regulator [Candidatus Coatesbacteria bacterium]